MNIVRAHYVSAEKDRVRVETTDSGVLICPWPCQTWHNEAIQAWLAAGNVIEDASASGGFASLEDAKAAKLRAIDTWRTEATDAGMLYTIQGKPEVVQTRAEDRENLMGLESEANHLRNQGVAEAVMVFRTESDREYMLTPYQMIDLCRAAFQHKVIQYQKAWALKARVESVETAEELNAITWE